MAGLGFAQEAAMIVLPMAPFLVDSDLTPVAEKAGDLVDGLTTWQPAVTTTGVQQPASITIEANGFEAAYDQFNR